MVEIDSGTTLHHIGLVGGLFTIAGMFVAARWHDQRQKRSVIKVPLPEKGDAHCMKDGADRPLSVRLSKRPETNLLRDDQRGDRKAPREPIFGPGAAPFLAELIISIGALGLLLLVLLLAHSVKEKASGLMFGASASIFGSEAVQKSKNLAPEKTGLRSQTERY